jgi:hypothetical protein
MPPNRNMWGYLSSSMWNFGAIWYNSFLCS